MKKITALCTAIFCLWSAPASASPYVSGLVGFGSVDNSNEIEYKTASVYSAVVGVKSGDYRIECAGGYQRQSLDKEAGDPLIVIGEDASVRSVMFNAYRDFTIKDSSVIPYVMAGLGGAKVKVIDNGVTEIDENAFVWQIGAGIGIKASEQCIIDFGCRYFNPSKVNDDEGGKISMSSSNILVGVRYNL
ncbi:MAG: outer membrane beta-barrel protein [Chlorobiaceae bacterium]